MRFNSNHLVVPKLLILSIALLIVTIPGSVLAVEVDLTRFLSDFARGSGPPDATTDNFFGTAGAGRVIVVNGNDYEKASRVTSAVIRLNGEIVLGPNRFNKNVDTIEIPVDLVADNSISVEIRGKPGSYLTVRVKQAVDVNLNVTGRIHFNTNVSSFPDSQAFYQSIGFVGGFGFPDTNTLEVAEAIGIDTPTEYDGSEGPEAGGYLLHGNLIFLASFGGGFIDLIEFTIPRNDEPPYSNLNHLGMARAAMLTNDLDLDYAYMTGVLGVEFLSPPATRSNGARFAIFRDPDGTFYELIEASPPLPLPTVFTNIASVGQVNINVSDFERSRAFYRMLGFTGSVPLAPTDSLEVAQAMGFDEEYLIDGELIINSADGSAIELVQWIEPYDPSPPYPLPINHFGINRLAYSTSDLEADVEALMAQGVEFVSPIAPCCSGPLSTTGIISFFDPDGTMIELVGPITPPE
jgi:catechol 2,3-dioxygenase-like lactoylglutathione lyase family enzyme